MLFTYSYFLFVFFSHSLVLIWCYLEIWQLMPRPMSTTTRTKLNLLIWQNDRCWLIHNVKQGVRSSSLPSTLLCSGSSLKNSQTSKTLVLYVKHRNSVLFFSWIDRNELINSSCANANNCLWPTLLLLKRVFVWVVQLCLAKCISRDWGWPRMYNFHS